MKKTKPVLRHGEEPKIIKCVSEKDAAEKILTIIDEIINNGKSSIGIITKSLQEGKILEKIFKRNKKVNISLVKGNEKENNDDIVIIPSYLTKGLEFDATIIYNPSKENYSDNLLDQRLLYVSLTRALHYEYIIEIENISNLINQ